MAEASRWGQLTYASFDPGGGAGGWQIKETRGDFSPAELREISAHLVTSFDSHVPLPEYPTPADVASQPRRCVHLLAHGGAIGAGIGTPATVSAGCTVHAVQAGNDATGRPGNVFSQTVLDRRPTALEPRIRPIEFWRSFDLLTPYGAQDVLDARLRDGQYPAPSGLMGRDLVLDFVFDAETWRMGVLSVLLDAVAEALQGGRRVVMVTAGPDQAALWIAAVSWCMAPTTARAFSWSVYERATRLSAAFERGVHLIGVPRDDVGRIDRDEGQFVVIDEDELPSLGQLGAAPHRTAAGDEVQATAWSQLAQESLVDAPTAAGVLGMLDDVADRSGPRVLTPAWPLAVAHLVTAPNGSDTSVATRVAAAEAPSGTLDASLAEHVRSAVRRQLDTGTAAAWEALRATPPDTFQASILAEEYLCRALGDPAWLTRDGDVPLPAPAALAGAATETVRAAYVGALATGEPEVGSGAAQSGVAKDGVAKDGGAEDSAAEDSAAEDSGESGQAGASGAGDTAGGVPGADPVVVLRLADLGVRLGLVDDPALRGRTVDALRRDVAPKLLRDDTGREPQQPSDDGAEPILMRAGLLDPRLHLELVPEALRAVVAARAPGAATTANPDGTPAGLLLPSAVAWIGERGLPRAGVATDDLRDDAIGDEVAAWLVRHRPREPGAGKALAGRLLRRYRSWYGIPSALRVVQPRHLWHLDELLEIERDHPSGLPGDFFVPHFACAPPSLELTRLAERLAMRGSTREARIARMRLDAEAAGSRQPSVSIDDTLRLTEQLWTSFGRHFALDVFAPLDLEASLLSAASSLDVSGWAEPRFELLRAEAASADAVNRAATMLSSHLASAPESLGRGTLAGLLALDVMTDPANADLLDHPAIARTRRVGDLADPTGRRIVTIVVDALVGGLDDELRRAIVTDAVARLASVAGEVSDRRRTELERLATQRLRGDERSNGDGWFRPFRNRQLKEH
ncbi:hypothetical protein GCM10011490_01610 [Pseudoclavibacter endophyticus]|uniref:Uncharacterized protein n=1 Tax=Pseudoclavibacter endophyticus TaxID=1778590 RepID=A0A6H9WRP0_9MICO|nr:hypothetical protein [Pseudoclavibacter endophyticus]KAB1650291.1 hypothetical protein F8O04_08900 [Pseudoclavibacter endophyticus]GGA55422.1 hypothetical protein GCM10011490_01610 [Pseudoclavibacter endophyticus]